MTTSLSEIMLNAIGISEEQLERLIIRSPHAYKIYNIKKKSGGERTIAQPAKETKYVQNWLINNIFCHLPIHDCASAYKKGASIKSNAAVHCNNEYIAKFDFRNFFPSISSLDLVCHFEKHLTNHVNTSDFPKIARLCCIRSGEDKNLCLSIGAPSSPLLSNSVMYSFDEMIHQWCLENGFKYTRYADDLTFSTNRKYISSKILPFIESAIKKISYPSLEINEEKTIHTSKKYQRRITGVIINNEGELSIGRDRKRLISSLIHKFKIGILDDEQIFHLQGLIGFSKDVEPDFLARMGKKYGFATIASIAEIRKKPSEGVF